MKTNNLIILLFGGVIIAFLSLVFYLRARGSAIVADGIVEGVNESKSGFSFFDFLKGSFGKTATDAKESIKNKSVERINSL